MFYGKVERNWVLLAFFLLVLVALFSILRHDKAELSPFEKQHIGTLIFQNECAGQRANLTTWNSGEAFPSLGIGHFIWYPANQTGPFKESFPALMAFFQQHGVALPQWLVQTLKHGAPWPSKEAFEQAKTGQQLSELRALLWQTFDLQVEFMMQRLERALPAILTSLPADRRPSIRSRFDRIAATPMGYYALIDYVNFKGEGIKASERYHGQGWGLLQVLEQMGDAGDAVEAFADAAVFVLERRVANAPPERNEARWLPGWKNRIASYVREQRKFSGQVSTTR